jgi:hypothetical protein
MEKLKKVLNPNNTFLSKIYLKINFIVYTFLNTRIIYKIYRLAITCNDPQFNDRSAERSALNLSSFTLFIKTGENDVVNATTKRQDDQDTAISIRAC